jgi:hypothetical protein
MSKTKEYKPIKPVLGSPLPKPVECRCDKPLLDGRVCFRCGRPLRKDLQELRGYSGVEG